MTTAAFGAVGPEFPISTPSAAEAAFSQKDPSVASNGSDYFAVWLDTRSSPDQYAKGALYGSRVDTTGRFVDAFGGKIADDIYSARVASNGRGYLLVYSDYAGNTVGRRISDDGTLASASTYLWPGLVYALASNGNGFCTLVADAAAQKFTAVFLDSDGVQRGVADPGDLRQPVLFAAGADYRTVDQQWTCDGVHACTVAVRLTSISSSTGQITARVLGPQIAQSTAVNAMATNDRIFIAFTSEIGTTVNESSRVVTMFSTDFDGNDVSATRQVASGSSLCFCSTWKALLAWDGAHVLVGWPDPLGDQPLGASQKRIVAVRVNPDGTQVDAQPFVITTAVSADFTSARGAGGVLLASTEYRHPLQPFYGSSDVYARHVRSFAEFAAGPVPASVVSSAPAQFDAAVASSGSRAIVAWREFDQPSAVAAAVVTIGSSSASPSVTLSPPGEIEKLGISIAALRDVGLVAWREETDRNVNVFAERIGFDGVVRDAQPIDIATDAKGTPWRGITSIATDGSQFLVVWNVDQNVLAVRILPDGTILDKEPIVVSRDSQYPFRRVDPRVVWTGTTFLVIWADDPDCHCLLISPPPPPQTIVRTARVTSSGAVLDATDSPTLIHKPGFVAEVAIARNGAVVMAVWSASDDDPDPAKYANRCMHALPLDPEGHPLATTPLQFGCESLQNVSSPFIFDVTVVPKDNGFAVLWSANGTHDVPGVFLAPSGTVVSSFAISTPSEPTWSPATTASPFGTFIVYSRIAAEPQYGGVARLFGRVLDAIAIGKRRAVRRF